MKIKKSVLVLLVFLTGCAGKLPSSFPGQPPLTDLGPAPELSNQTWLNSDRPLRLADLHGKVVLLEFWTFECINCQHTIPYLNAWYSKYSPQGLVVIGDHYPEYPEEAVYQNLQQAIRQLGIHYPVAQDNQGTTWNGYDNMYWPSIYLIDKRGHIRYNRIGEGGYSDTEAAIQTLLAEAYP
jgi:thiol-disulfide isomerase/thioredoxin